MMVLAWIGLLVAALLGAPLFVLIGAAALLGFLQADYDLTIVAVEFQRLGQMPGLEAIPLFALAGCLLGDSGAPQRLVRLSRAWLGWLPGGLAIVAVVSCALFTAFTGASGVTIVALGALLFPALIAAGYERRFVLGLLTSAGSLGLLFAPSLPLILYGFVAGQLGTDPPVSIQDLFLAGIAPGVLMVFAMSLLAVQAGRHLPPGPDFDRREAVASLIDARWELPLPVLVLGGIYGGLLAASEAAAVTALYVLVTTVLIRREIPLRRLLPACADAARLIGAILIILGMALALSNWLVDQEVPMRLFDWVQAHVDSPWVFLLLLNVFLLGVGMLLDIFSAVVILVPLLLPVAQGFGIDPVHLGIILLANLQLGYFTPPVGMNLFIASYRFEAPVTELVSASWRFFLVLLGCVLLITWWPWLSLALVR
ncbi:TRAP transporter large permease [Pseudomarimonas salicorniae]|uniref:TRAP transporter large permease protein n=1 Tax=Pseudomarimonas salicorniae TaxID=2933270 RepID=A0ABT0GEK8_9GAMM|nr:TRAP transporter large permease subunit [Lysobacter sp. CAU 1642]MCK7592986.1 TRAP transporter large permease subunit [Lysobacter sp. CAU 1642]